MRASGTIWWDWHYQNTLRLDFILFFFLRHIGKPEFININEHCKSVTWPLWRNRCCWWFLLLSQSSEPIVSFMTIRQPVVSCFIKTLWGLTTRPAEVDSRFNHRNLSSFFVAANSSISQSEKSNYRDQKREGWQQWVLLPLTFLYNHRWIPFMHPLSPWVLHTMFFC